MFLPLAALTGAALWFGLGRRDDRLMWVAAGVVLAATLSGVLVGQAPPSRGRLLEAARDLPPEFYEEVDSRTSGNSWCRPDCPSATVTFKPPGTGDPAVMLDLATPLFNQGLLTSRAMAEITRKRSFETASDDISYKVTLTGEGDDRRLIVELTAR